MEQAEPEDHGRAKCIRFPELDALRGVASGAVVVLHFHDMWVDRLPVAHGRLMNVLFHISHGFYNGASAVLLFFVLSGFVLSMPLLQGRRQPYPLYALRRVTRIYLPFVAALAIALVGDALLYLQPHPSAWSAAFWSAPVSLPSVLGHLGFIGFYNTARYDFVVWTLVHEMRISLLFPLLFATVWRLRGWAALPALAIAALYEPINGPLIQPPFATRTSVAQTIFFLLFFAAGILLAMYREPVAAVWRKLTLAFRAGMAAAVLVLYLYPGVGVSIVQAVFRRIHLRPLGEVAQYQVSSLLVLAGAVGALVLAMNCHPVKRLLLTRLLAFFGRISFSLYLIHPLVLLTLSLSLAGRVSIWLQLPIYLAGSVLGGWLFCLAVEEPCMRLSHRLGQGRGVGLRLAGGLAVAEQASHGAA